MHAVTGLRAVALNCTLKKSPAPSSTDLMVQLLVDALGEQGVETEVMRGGPSGGRGSDLR